MADSRPSEPCSQHRARRPFEVQRGLAARAVRPSVTCISPLQSGPDAPAERSGSSRSPPRSGMREHLLSAISLSLLVHTASLIAFPALRTVPHRDQRASAWRVCANAGRGGGSRVGYQGRGQGRGRSNGRGRGRGQSDGRAMRQPPRQARPAPGDEGGGWEPTGATPQTPRSPRPATPVPEHLMVNLRANGVEQLNAFQERAHSAMSYGLDVVVHAETGAGKTLRIDPRP